MKLWNFYGDKWITFLNYVSYIIYISHFFMSDILIFKGALLIVSDLCSSKPYLSVAPLCYNSLSYDVLISSSRFWAEPSSSSCHISCFSIIHPLLHRLSPALDMWSTHFHFLSNTDLSILFYLIHTQLRTIMHLFLTPDLSADAKHSSLHFYRDYWYYIIKGNLLFSICQIVYDLSI